MGEKEEQKERLEQELRFLKESLDAGIISKEEYEKGRSRVEKKLKEIEEGVEEVKKEGVVEEKVEEEGTREETKEEVVVEEGMEEKKEEEKEEKTETIEKPVEEKKPSVYFSKKKVYFVALLVAIVILFFIFKGGDNKEAGIEKGMEYKENIEALSASCSSDSDCKEEGKIGKCINPGTKEARCEFKDIVSFGVRIINDDKCKLCDSSWMEEVIIKLFPGARIERIELNKAGGLIRKYGIEAIPAYIFDSAIENASNFDNFKTALKKKKDAYVLSSSASNYFFKRKEIKNRLELFYTRDDDEEKIMKSLNEVLDLFGDKINFTRKIVTNKEKERLKETRGITAYPSFIINNRVKFSGYHSAETIKDRFCMYNKIKECDTSLSIGIG